MAAALTREKLDRDLAEFLAGGKRITYVRMGQTAYNANPHAGRSLQARPCERCGRTYQPRSTSAKYCGSQCANAAVNERLWREKEVRARGVRKCMECGGEFNPMTPGNTLCSDECRRERANRNQRAEAIRLRREVAVMKAARNGTLTPKPATTLSGGKRGLSGVLAEDGR